MACYNADVVETHLELEALRCPRCAGQLVLRVLADERGRSVLLTLDTACVACGVSPWLSPDQRSLVFTPGASIGEGLDLAAEDADARLAAALDRIDTLLRRCESLENSLAAAQRNLARAEVDERRRRGDVETDLRGEISRLEGEFAEARAEVRKAEEATRGEIAPGKRPIEVE